LLPWRLAFSGRFDTIRFDGAIGPFLLIFLVLDVASAIFLIRRRLARGITKEIIFMFIISASFFVFGTQQARFWLPSQMLTSAFAAPAVNHLVNWGRRKRPTMAVVLLILLGSLGWNMLFLGKQLLTVGYYKPVLGMEEERAFLIRRVPGYPALEYINRNLPENSCTLCVWTGAYGYYIDKTYFSDTFIEDITLKSFINVSSNGKDLSQRMIKAGFTHLYVSLPLVENNMLSHQKEIFSDFIKHAALELFREGNYFVFAISRE